jgi:hypothetical protein
MLRIALMLSLVLAGSGFAAEAYRYRFSPGKPLTYRTSLTSEGRFTLPDGSPKTVKLAAQSTVKLTPEAKDGEGWKVTSQTTRAETSLDGMAAPAPKGADAKKTITVRPDGTVTGAEESTFAIAFPARALNRGDSFTEEKKSAGDSLPLKTTWTLVETGAALAGHPGKMSVFEAKSELGRTSRKMTLKRGGGKVWFDAASGMVVKSDMAYDFTEEVSLPGADKAGSRATSLRYVSELER